MRLLATPIYFAFFSAMGAGYVMVGAWVLAMYFPHLFCDEIPIGADKPIPKHWFLDWAPWIGAMAGFVVAWLLPRAFRRRGLDPSGMLAAQPDAAVGAAQRARN